jgi:ribosomal protein S14
MPTIVEYTDRKKPKNLYPVRIISPLRPGPCCDNNMEEIGEPRQEERWVSQYKRCRKCGFTVRMILRELPDLVLSTGLRELLSRTVVRGFGY